MKFNFFKLVAFGLLVGSTGAQAGIIYDNGGPLEGGGTGASDLDPFNTIYQEIADDFTITSLTAVTGINWWGAYTPNDQAGGVPDDFSIRVFNDLYEVVFNINVGAVNRVDTGLQNAFDFNIYAYEAVFAPLMLDAGTYWLSIVNNTAGDLDNERWSWQTTANSTGQNARFRRTLGTAIDIDSGWAVSIDPNDPNAPFEGVGQAQGDFAFAIRVPEPSTLALLGIGLVGMGLTRRRKKV